MVKTQKELAFLRDLYLQDDWTKRFTDLVDKHIDLKDAENMLYLNAGTGGHAMAVSERFGEKTNIFASCENEDLLAIARDKAAAISSDVDFSVLRFENDAFDAVLADGSLVHPAEVGSLIENTVRVARTGGDVAVYLPTAGSFGEVFSLLWEVLVTEEILGYAAEIERLIAEIPTVSTIESFAKQEGIVNINTELATELFEFENGEEFVSSPLIDYFLMPTWLATLSEDEKERVRKQLAHLIDSEEGALPFRFTVKVTLLTGEKG
jgi:ubiquinone/menaquinone biosynthesis C-methylase UbiE